MKFTKRDLQHLMLALHSSGEALYTGILFRCVREVGDAIPTAAVAYQHGKFKLIANGDFMAELDEREQMGVLKHEALHLVMGHLLHRRNEDPALQMIDNWAMDLAINSLLWVGSDPSSHEDRDWRNGTDLPRMCLMPGWPFPEPKPEVLAKMTPEDIARTQHLSDLIQSFPRGKAYEWYLEQLLNDEQAKESLRQKSFQELLEEMGFQMDEHGEWQDPGGEEGEAARAKIKGILERVTEQCNKTGKWGNVSAQLKDRLIDMLKSEVDWRRQLRNWVGMTRRGNRHTTWRRPNKRAPGLMTQGQRSWTASIGFYMDESGSVSDDELAEGFGEVKGLTRRREIDLLPFDHEVFEERKQTIKKGSSFTPARSLTGGTSFHAVMKHAKEHRKEYDGIIIFTDGGAADPGPPLRGQRRLWLVSSRGDMYFTPHPGDTVIKITGGKKGDD